MIQETEPQGYRSPGGPQTGTSGTQPYTEVIEDLYEQP